MSDDGGPAFPSPRAYKGMSLRDYFAGQALVGLAQLLTDNEVSALADGIKGGAIQARAAYTLADAMLKERSK